MENQLSDAQIGQMIFRAISESNSSSRSTDSYAAHEASFAELEAMEQLKAAAPEFASENHTFRPVQTKRLNTQTMDSGYFETANNQFNASMVIPQILQTAELKASLESKIASLTEKIKELTSHPLEDLTNRRITAMEQLQSQQVQVQNMLLEQMKQSNQLVRQQLCGDFRVNSADPRVDVPRPSVTARVEQHHPLSSAPRRAKDHLSEELNIDWLDEVSPLPVRPSSPVKIGQSQPIKIWHEKPESAFSTIENELEEVAARRRLFDENLKKQRRAQIDPLAEDEFLDEKPIKLKVSKAISDARAKVPTKVASKQRFPREKPKAAQTTQRSSVIPRRKAPQTARKTQSVEFADEKLRSIYGRAEWQGGAKRLGRNPYIYHQSPPKHHTNVQISQGIRVRSSKSQTTPRLGLERGESAIQIAPPVRAGPSSRNRRSYSPESASTVSISSTSEVLSSTPIPSAELVDRSQNTSVTPMATTEPTNTQPYSSVETQATLTSDSRQPPLIIKPSYEAINERPASPQVDDRVDELKGWLEREFMSKFIQQGVKPNPHPVVPPRHHQQPQDERLLRKLVEDRVRKYLREMRREKTPPAPEPVVQRKAEPLIVSQTYVRPMTPSPIHSIESPAPIELEAFIDETVANISTPDPSQRPPRSPSPKENNTLENLPIDESDESFKPILQKSESERTISSFTAGHTPEMSNVYDDEFDDELAASQIITPGASTKSVISINSLDGKSSPTPIRSSTPGKAAPPQEIEERPPSIQEEPVVQSPPSLHTQSEESTLCSSTDATFSPGELIISFGEYRAPPKTLPKRQNTRNRKTGDSLSEGEIECSANDVSPVTSREFSEGEIRYRVKNQANPANVAMSAPFEETISEESEYDDPTDLQPDNSLSDQSN